jgi:hypothetical protein
VEQGEGGYNEKGGATGMLGAAGSLCCSSDGTESAGDGGGGGKLVKAM